MSAEYQRTEEEQDLLNAAREINPRIAHLSISGTTIFWWLDTVSIETRQRITCDTRLGFDWSIKQLMLFAERNI